MILNMQFDKLDIVPCRSKAYPNLKKQLMNKPSVERFIIVQESGCTKVLRLVLQRIPVFLCQPVNHI